MSAKRKVPAAPVADSPSQKKPKIPLEKREEVTEKGLSFLRFLKAAKDKGGHTISEHFLSLPSKDEIPDYYEVTKLPIALDTIQGKLDRAEYPTMTTVESDLKRMVFNAKAFNEKTSEIHRDAEKIRKMVTHHMKERKLNPAYQDPAYASFPTPLPGEEDDDDDEKDAEGEEDDTQALQLDGGADTPDGGEAKPRPRKLLIRGPSTATPADSEGVAPSESEETGRAPGRQRLRLSKPSAEKERIRQQSNPAASEPESQGPPIKKLKLRAPATDKDNTGRESSAAVSDADNQDESQGSKRQRVPTRKQSEEQSGSRPRSSATPATQGAADANEGFEGRTMQGAQDKIVQDMLDLFDDDGETHIAGPFVNLPSRDIKDYYQVIKHPVSLKAVQKLVRGVKGREKPTWQTLLPTWQEFEDEMSYIWDNARHYNEDESEISQLAGKLEAYFKKRVAQARVSVPDPPGAPKLKLNLHVKEPEQTPKLKISAGQKRPAEEMSNYTVDTEALKRQRQLVLDGVNGRIGQPPPRPPSLARESSAASIKLDRDSSINEATTVRLQVDNTNASQPLKDVSQGVRGTTPNNSAQSSDIPPLAAASMPPPPTTPLGLTPRPVSQPRAPPIPLPRHPFDSWRRANRPEGYRWPYSTITEIIVESHPILDLGSKAYRWVLRPWPDFNYATDVLPMRKESKRILVAPLFIKPTNDRPFVASHVMLNGVRQYPSPSTQRITNDERPVFDFKLDMNDINEIEIQCFTQPSDPCTLQDVIFDKYTVIIHPRAT